MAAKGPDDKATVIVNTMHFYTAAADTAAPQMTQLASTASRAEALSAWTEIGHTSLESPFKLTSEGGEVTVKGSLQKKALRTTTSDKTFTIELDLEQFDAATIKRYLGANAAAKNGLTYAKSKPTAERAALLGIAEDDNGILVIHAGRVDIGANGDIDVSNVEDLAALPIKFTVLEDADGNTIGISPVTPVTK